MNELRVIAITHKHFSLEEIGKFHIAPEHRNDALAQLKNTLGLSEIMFLSTCNRVEIIFSQPHYVCPGQTTLILQNLYDHLPLEFLKEKSNKFYHLIALAPSRVTLPDGRNAHLILKSKDWWRNKFVKLGYTITFEKHMHHRKGDRMVNKYFISGTIN